MNSKRTAMTILLTLLISVFAVGAVAADDVTPRAPLPTDILLNDSFDGGNANYWTVTNASGDKVKCADGLGHISDCAFMFVGGANEATTITQVYKPSGTVDSGVQFVDFIAHVKPTKAGQQLRFSVKVKMLGGGKVKKSFVYTSVAANANYENVSFETDLFNANAVKKISVSVTNLSTSGKTYVDAFYVGAYGGFN